MNEHNILSYALAEGIIDIGIIQAQIEVNERNKYLNMHINRIWNDDAGRFYTYLPADQIHNKRRLIKRKDRSALDDAIIAYYKSIETQILLKDIFYQWIEEKRLFGEIQKQSYDKYKTVFGKYIEGSDIASIQVRYITEYDLEKFIKSTIHDNELTAKAWSNLRILIYGIFKYAKKHGQTNISITSFMGDLELPRNIFAKTIKEDRESVFTDSEIEKITEYIYHDHITQVSLGILFAFQSGLRCGELSALKYSDLDGNTLRVNKTEVHYRNDQGKYVYEVRNYTKGREGHREIIISDAAIKTYKQIRMLNPFSEYLFETQGSRTHGKAFTNRLYAICKAIGIPPRSIHKARKTYATKLLNAGVTDRVIMQQMGHTDIETTRKYYYYNNLDKKEIEEMIKKAIG